MPNKSDLYKLNTEDWKFWMDKNNALNMTAENQFVDLPCWSKYS